MVKYFIKSLDKLPFKGVYCCQKEKVFAKSVENDRFLSRLLYFQFIWHILISNKSGGSVMKYYDARIIENCCVFSYEVQTPDRSSKKGEKRKRSSVAWKKALLRFLLFLLLPFAWIIDSVVLIAKKAFRKLTSFLRRPIRGYVFVTYILSSVSLTALVSLLMTLF